MLPCTEPTATLAAVWLARKAPVFYRYSPKTASALGLGQWPVCPRCLENLLELSPPCPISPTEPLALGLPAPVMQLTFVESREDCTFHLPLVCLPLLLYALCLWSWGPDTCPRLSQLPVLPWWMCLTLTVPSKPL